MSGLPEEIKLTYLVALLLAFIFLFFILAFVYFYKNRQTALYKENLLKDALMEQQQLQAALDKQKELQAERERISADMHDDLGSGLSSIRLISEMLKRKHRDAETIQDLDQIMLQAVELTAAMREMVWSLNPQQDRLDKFVHHICNYTRHFFEPSGIRASIEVQGEAEAIPMGGMLRRNVLLCIKEVLNNIVKHAHTDEVLMHLDVQPGSLMITIRDKGSGFKPGYQANNGLFTMKKRIEDSKGNIHWENANPGVLTRISIPV